MNATLFLMGSALVTGGDPGCAGCASPAPVAHYAPVSVYAPGGMSCDTCSSSPGLLARLKYRFSSGGGRPGLFSKLCGKKHNEPCGVPCDSCGPTVAAPAQYSACALPAVPGYPAAPVITGVAPQEMPKPPAAMPGGAMPAPMPGVMPPAAAPMPKPISVPEPVPAPNALPVVTIPPRN